VRSQPHSAFVPHFNKPAIEEFLVAAGVGYAYMGSRLGGRYTDPAVLFPDGRVNFALVRQSRRFLDGMTELIECLRRETRVALLCAEKDPFDCHRFVLLGRSLEERCFTVTHILDEENVVTNKQLEEKLLKAYEKRNYQYSFLEPAKTPQELLAEAYELRNKDIIAVRR
jgi:uncharacterized protein (DUF488 family)